MRKFKLILTLILLSTTVLPNSNSADYHPCKLAESTKQAFDQQASACVDYWIKTTLNDLTKTFLNYANLEYEFKLVPPKIPIYVENDNTRNQDSIGLLEWQLKRWYESEVINGDLTNFILPNGILSGIIESREKYEVAFSKIYSPIYGAVRDELNSKIDGNRSYSWTYLMPSPPIFKNNDGVGNHKRLQVYNLNLTAWANLEIPTISMKNAGPDESTLQPDADQLIKQCDAQSTANTKAFTNYRVALELISSLVKNSKLQAQELSVTEDIVQLRKQLNEIKNSLLIYNQKLPIYLESLPKCQIYSAQILEVKELLTVVNDLENKLINLEIPKSVVTNETKSPSASPTITKIEVKILEADKAGKVTPLSLALADKKLPISCKKGRSIATFDLGKCPTGWVKR